MITIVDYGVGNLKSLCNALRFLQLPYRIAGDRDAIRAAEKIVLPGVGAFGYAMQCMESKGIHDVVIEKTKDGVPILGVCLGMQLLFTGSEEAGNVKGLDLIPGRVRRFKGKLKVPHMGWNEVKLGFPSRLLRNLPESRYAYFVHSFYCQPTDKTAVSGLTSYGISFCSLVARGNIFGAQFHPEKSQEFGLAILENFASI